MSELQTSPEETEIETQTPQTEVEETTQTPAEETVETPATEPTAEQPSDEPDPSDPDYKDKFVKSQREAILLNERNKVKDAQIEQLTKTDTPTDEMMRKLYPDWDELNEVTQRAFVNQEIQSIKQRRIEVRQDDIIARQKLDDELEAVIDANPKLDGKEAEFKRFARSPKNKGIPAETLAKAFLFDVEDAPAPKPKDEPNEALPQGSGGPRDSVAPKKMSIEEAMKLKTTDNKRYMELVKAGEIDDTI